MLLSFAMGATLLYTKARVVVLFSSFIRVIILLQIVMVYHTSQKASGFAGSALYPQRTLSYVAHFVSGCCSSSHAFL